MLRLYCTAPEYDVYSCANRLQMRPAPPIRSAVHGSHSTGCRLRRRNACVAKPRLAPLRGGGCERLLDYYPVRLVWANE